MTTTIFLGVLFLFFALFSVLALLFRPVKELFKLLLHSAIGWVGLYIWNSLIPSCFIGINIASASIAGILGLPGMALMILTKIIFRL